MGLAFQMHFPCCLGFHRLLLFVSVQDNRLFHSPRLKVLFGFQSTTQSFCRLRTQRTEQGLQPIRVKLTSGQGAENGVSSVEN